MTKLWLGQLASSLATLISTCLLSSVQLQHDVMNFLQMVNEFPVHEIYDQMTTIFGMTTQCEHSIVEALCMYTAFIKTLIYNLLLHIQVATYMYHDFY